MADNVKRHEIYWNNALIGYMTNTRMDMWYLEGDWLPVDCEETREFAELLKGKSARDWFDGKIKEGDFIWIGFDKNKPTNWIVLVCEDTSLFLRIVSSIKPPEEW